MSRNTIRCQNPACRAPLARIHHTDRIDLLVERATDDEGVAWLVCACGARRAWTTWKG